MNGNKFLLDTNALIFLLKGDPRLSNLNVELYQVNVSVISVIEFLVYEGLSLSDKTAFDLFCKQVNVIGLDSKSDSLLINTIIEMRKKYKLILPDAIIVSSAIISQSTLITADKELFKISEINYISI